MSPGVKPVLIDIVPGYPGLYTDVRRFHFWVKRQMSTLGKIVTHIAAQQQHGLTLPFISQL